MRNIAFWIADKIVQATRVLWAFDAIFVKAFDGNRI
jgi:hypothetical protein